MTPDFVVGFAKQAIETTLLVSAPMLGIGLVVGLVIAIFQSVTQIHEMTLTFVPKIIAVMVALVAFSPWMLQKLIAYAQNVMMNIPQYIR
jgi:flagellar biosynthetic protein FliQ